MDYNTIKHNIFNATKRIRNLAIAELSAELAAIVSELGFSIKEGWAEFRLNQSSKKYIKHMLARVTDYIERGCDLPGNYCQYIAQRTKRPFEVEHVITDHYEWYTDEFSSKEEFESFRNNLGNLALLDKATNSSINDDPYMKKLPVYESADRGNIYTASLGPKAYEHNPRFKTFVERYGYDFKSYGVYNKNTIAERNKLLYSIVSDIWSITSLQRQE